MKYNILEIELLLENFLVDFNQKYNFEFKITKNHQKQRLQLNITNKNKTILLIYYDWVKHTFITQKPNKLSRTYCKEELFKLFQEIKHVIQNEMIN